MDTVQHTRSDMANKLTPIILYFQTLLQTNDEDWIDDDIDVLFDSTHSINSLIRLIHPLLKKVQLDFYIPVL